MSLILGLIAWAFWLEGTDRHNMYIDDDTFALQIAAAFAVATFLAWMVEYIGDAIRERGQR